MIFTTNKTIKGAYESYKRSYDYSLDEVYGSYSNAKARAWNYCTDLMREYDGAGIKVIGHNCMTFSVGFIGYVDGLKHFFYITRDYDRAMPLEKLDKETGEVLAIS